MFTLTLVTPEKRLLTDVEVDEVYVPGEMGDMDILPGHAPLVSTLRTGILKYKLKGSARSESVAVSWGFCQVFPGGVSVLADTAETATDMDPQRADKALKLAQQRLGMAGIATEELLKFQRKELRARTRLNLNEK